MIVEVFVHQDRQEVHHVHVKVKVLEESNEFKLKMITAFVRSASLNLELGSVRWSSTILVR